MLLALDVLESDWVELRAHSEERADQEHRQRPELSIDEIPAVQQESVRSARNENAPFGNADGDHAPDSGGQEERGERQIDGVPRAIQCHVIRPQLITFDAAIHRAPAVTTVVQRPLSTATTRSELTRKTCCRRSHSRTAQGNSLEAAASRSSQNCAGQVLELCASTPFRQ